VPAERRGMDRGEWVRCVLEAGNCVCVCVGRVRRFREILSYM